jgi:TrmH family RNA methyltransferase
MVIKSISSKDNAIFKHLKSLSLDNTAYRKSPQIWLEGEHLCLAAKSSGLKITHLVIVDSVKVDSLDEWDGCCESIIQLSVALMSALSSLPSPARICCVVELPETKVIQLNESAVVLDQVQDPGNAGAILRCAAAFGFKQIITTRETVALWSAKVVRAAMGAHFGLQINETLEVSDVAALNMPLLLTDVHKGEFLH